MAKRPPKKPPVHYFYPQKTLVNPEGWIDFSIVQDYSQALSEVPSWDSRLIARMRFEEGKPAVMLPGVWGYCDCHGWQFDPSAIPDDFGRMAFPFH